RGKPACPQWLAGHPLRPALLAAKHLLTTICLRSLAPPHKRARAQEGLFARCRRRQLTGPPSQNGRYINPCILSPLLAAGHVGRWLAGWHKLALTSPQATCRATRQQCQLQGCSCAVHATPACRTGTPL